MMELNDGSESDIRSTVSSSSGPERRRVDQKQNIGIQGRRSDELNLDKISRNFEYLSVYGEEEEIGMRVSERVMDKRNVDLSPMEGFWSAQRYSKEGLFARSSFEYENQMLNRNGMGEIESVEYARTGNMINGKEKVPRDSWNADAGFRMNKSSMQYSYPESQGKRLPYQNQYAHPPALIHGREIDGNGDPLRSQMLRKNPTPYQNQPSHAYKAGQFMNDDMVYNDSMDPYPPIFSRHHPSCSCFDCNKREVPLSAQSSVHGAKRYGVSNDMMFNYHDTHGSFVPHEYNKRISDLPFARSQNHQLHTRWPSDVNSEVDGITCRRPQRMHLPSGGLQCRPIAGGVPFFTCYNCFELLMLPKKVFTKSNKRKEIRCGGCSTVIAFAVSNNNLVVLSDDFGEMDIPVKAQNNPIALSTHGDGWLNQTRDTFPSDDYDDSGYHYQSMDREIGQLPTGQGRENKSTNSGQHNSASTYTFEAVEDRENLRESGKDSSSVYLAAKDKPHPPPAGSAGDKLLPDKASQIAMADMSLATEIDILSNEYANTGTTFDSGEGSRGDTRKRSKAMSFLSSIYKDKINGHSNGCDQTDEPEKANVTVNGHLVPDRLIRKAEKFAGSVEPGHYWYDFRAGFWGVMGGSCVGIIPPFISEFNYPMADNCSGGNTGIFVNGRELSQRDLNMLSKRGLPIEQDKSYIVEISGRILDADTGAELQSLGKLAPSVEKAKRGFGMRDPNAPAQPTNS